MRISKNKMGRIATIFTAVMLFSLSIDIGLPRQTIIVVTLDMNVARQTDSIITMRDGMIASDTGVKGNEEHGL